MMIQASLEVSDIIPELLNSVTAAQVTAAAVL